VSARGCIGPLRVLSTSGLAGLRRLLARWLRRSSACRGTANYLAARPTMPGTAVHDGTTQHPPRAASTSSHDRRLPTESAALHDGTDESGRRVLCFADLLTSAARGVLRSTSLRDGPVVVLQALRSAASRRMPRSCASTWRSSSNSSERVCTRLSRATSSHRASQTMRAHAARLAVIGICGLDGPAAVWLWGNRATMGYDTRPY
jgi:hypothetical protein